ncbi:phage tail tape measure protein [Lacinutrix iliipiscaria]|uniref:Phage tail tape measure protein n=1 Tax=Lacinutrix iliipiscaria TaxID=1230532 RepID=A0ABW5WQY1_9FLAO
MAGKLTREKLQVDVVINGNQAQAELFKLEKRQRELKTTNKELYAERAKLIAQGKKTTQEYKNLTSEIKKNNAELKSNKLEISALQNKIGITGLSMRQLRQRAAELRVSLNNMIPGSGKYKKLQADLKLVNTQLQKLSINSRASESSLSKVANSFNKYAALGASIIATGTGVVLTLQKMIDYNGKLSDAQSDVQKTTGMTKNEVDDLTKSFGLLKTRTQRIDLLKIAEEGGRVGIVKEEISDFVEVMNKATVALGDSFPGGVEEVASKLGILKNLFKETKDLDVDLAFNAIGSSINDLGAAGNATEDNLAEFAARVGSLPEALKPTVGEALALGAAFEESGIKAEISSRAYGIVLSQVTNNTDKFAKVMGITQKEVKDLVNTNPLEFFLQFSKGLKGMDATDIGETLKFLGVSSTGATKVIGAAANNQERFRRTIELSNKSLVDATSLTTEYDIKNNNLAATIAKVQKRLIGAFSSESVINGLNNFIEWFAKFIGASEDADGKVTKFRNRLVALLKAVIIITAAVISYNTAIKLAALWTGTLDKTTRLYILTQKAATVATTALRAITLLLSAGFNLVTLNLTRARAAMALFNRTLMLSPIGLVVGLITAAAGAYLLFSENSKKALTSQSLFNSALKEAESVTAETITQKKLLLDVARDETLSMQQRQEAVDELNRTVPEYNNNLTIESANTLAAKDALNKHIEALKQNAISHVLLERIKKKAVELADQENSSLQDNIKWYEQLWNQMKSGPSAIAAISKNTETAIKNKQDSINTTKEEIAALEELYKTQLKNNPTAPISPDANPLPTSSPGNLNTSGGSSKIKLPKGSAAGLLSAQQAAENARIALIQDAFVREMAQNDANHKFKLQKLQQQLVAEKELKILDKQIDVARAKGTTEGDNEASVLEQVKLEWVEKNKAINESIEYENSMHELRKGVIIEKGYSDDIKTSEEAYKREKVIREQQFLKNLNSIKKLQDAKNKLRGFISNEELEKLKTLDAAKKALQEQFDKEELVKQKEHLDALVAQLTSFMESGKFEGFDLTLLTPEQQSEFEAQVETLKLKIQELVAAKNSLSGGGEDEDDDGSGKLDLGEAGEMDVLGFTADQWLTTFQNIEDLGGAIGVASMGVQAFMNAWAKYHEFVSAKEDKALRKFEAATERKKIKQKNLLDSGLINRRQYDAAIKALEEEQDKRKAELEYKQAKRAWQMQLLNAIAGAAMATINGFNSTPFLPVGLIMGALAATLGTIQVGIIAKNKPVKGYQKGLYNITREQDGKQFNAAYGGFSRSGLVDEPTVFLAGEQGKKSPELIINGEDLKQFNPDLKNSLYREIGRVKGYEDGIYKSNPQQEESSSFNNTVNTELLHVIKKNTDLLQYIIDHGIEAYLERNYQNAKKIRDDIKALEKIENKSKR